LSHQSPIVALKSLYHCDQTKLAKPFQLQNGILSADENGDLLLWDVFDEAFETRKVASFKDGVSLLL
jgi:hypothetical protein